MQDSNSIQNVIAEKIKTSGPTVENIVINTLVDTEINRRGQVIIAGLAALGKLKKDVTKASQPDSKTYAFVEGDEKPIETKVFTEAGLKAKKAAEEKYNKLKKAIDTALETNDADAYNKVADASK